MDYFIIAVATLSALYFNWWLHKRIRRWVNRDLALSIAGDDAGKRDYMLQQLQLAEQKKVAKKELEAWLRQASERYTSQ